MMDNEQFAAMVESILPSPNPAWQLRGAMVALLHLGHSRQALELNLAACADRARDRESDDEWDAIADATDFLNGWSGGATIPPLPHEEPSA